MSKATKVSAVDAIKLCENAIAILRRTKNDDGGIVVYINETGQYHYGGSLKKKNF
jgi:hypothetical protein